MQSRIIFSIIMAFVTPCLLAQQTDSVATKVEEASISPRTSATNVASVNSQPDHTSVWAMHSEEPKATDFCDLNK